MAYYGFKFSYDTLNIPYGTEKVKFSMSDGTTTNEYEMTYNNGKSQYEASAGQNYLYLYRYDGNWCLETDLFDVSDVGDEYVVAFSTVTLDENFKSAVTEVLVEKGLTNKPVLVFDDDVTFTSEDASKEITLLVSNTDIHSWNVTADGVILDYSDGGGYADYTGTSNNVRFELQAFSEYSDTATLYAQNSEYVTIPGTYHVTIYGTQLEIKTLFVNLTDDGGNISVSVSFDDLYDALYAHKPIIAFLQGSTLAGTVVDYTEGDGSIRFRFNYVTGNSNEGYTLAYIEYKYANDGVCTLNDSASFTLTPSV